MSEKELALKLLDEVPAYKLGYVIAYLQGITADNAADDAFCEKLYEEYLATDEDEKNDFITLEEMAEISGVKLGEV